ncbi:hypothetical protein [Leeia aquatica]|uniref:Lipoprotein n=1 Tax=Leeia aquatica TaxID=2725557 RepID=A0A847RXQ9_9NEIS|nr:hypothetical protein [Leeia aquatica]NLR75940.1 hypothetical protein [Leeia aquatica]
MWKPVSFLLLPLLLTGCVSYHWVHDHKGEAEMSQDRSDCASEARTRFPEKLVEYEVSHAYYAPEVSRCTTTRSSTLTTTPAAPGKPGTSTSTDQKEERVCQTTPGRWVPAVKAMRDVNSGRRSSHADSCFLQKGWRWEEVQQ